MTNINQSVKRWDVYDVADSLEDYCPMLYRAFENKDWPMVLQLAEQLSDMSDQLWAMSARAGTVGPAPFYVNNF